jgi:hypothetical protein
MGNLEYTKIVKNKKQNNAFPTTFDNLLDAHSKINTIQIS